MPNVARPEADGALSFHCRQPGDLHDARARLAIAKFCREFLNGLKITPLELLHIGAYQHRLLDNGFGYQAAVQKAAMAQVEVDGGEVAARIREIYALVDAGMHQVAQRAKQRSATAITPASYGAFVTATHASHAEADAEDEIYTALARYLVGSASWTEKTQRLLTLSGDAVDDHALAYVDNLLGEVIANAMALNELVGPTQRLGELVDALLDLFSGRAPPGEGREALALLTQRMAERALPTTRARAVRQLRRALRVRSALASDDPQHEIDAHLALLPRLAPGGRFIGGDTTAALFERRIGWQLSFDQLSATMQAIPRLDDRARRLLQIHRAVASADNRRHIRAYLDFLYEYEKLPARLVEEQDAPLKKLRRLAELFRAIADAGLSDGYRDKYGAPLLLAHASIMSKSKVLERIESEADSPATRALRYIDLCNAGVFIPGAPLQAVQKRIRQFLERPDFLPSYMAGATEPAEQKRRLVELRGKLAAIGLHEATTYA